MSTTKIPPGPKGAFFGLSLAREFAAEPLKFITRIGKEYGDLAFFRMGPIRAAFVNHPDLVREVLVTKAKAFRKQPRTLNALRQVDGEGLVITEGDFWLRQRRLLQPAFSPKRMGVYGASIVERTRHRIDSWHAGETRDMVDEMTHLTLEIIAKVFYDTELVGRAADLGEAVRILSETFYNEVSYPLPLPDWLPLPSKRRKKWAIRTLHDLIDGFIRDRRASGNPDRGDLLSILLSAVDEEGDGKGMSDRQARDEAVTMFNAGHDSTAATLAWIWYLLARHPQVEARLLDEVRAVLGDRLPTNDDLPQLRYTESVVRETLRLYPVVWSLIGRVALHDVEIGDHSLPRGSEVFIFPWVIQHDCRFFPNPWQFDPDRFAPDRISGIPQYAWLPFGAGPHICIGQSLALNEMTLIVAMVLQQFRLQFAPGQNHEVEPEPLLAIRPKGGLKMTIHPRKW